jgi:hypothetical protein
MVISEGAWGFLGGDKSNSHNVKDCD